MTRHKRFILFLILVFLFLLITPLVILYSQGYRFNLRDRKITQTGGLYLNVRPKGASVYLDDKLLKKTDFLFGKIFIDDLVPRKYKIEIKKDGYYSWQKNLEIVESLTTEAKNIFLVPKDPEFTSLGDKIDAFFFSPDNEKVVLKKEGEEGFTLDLLDLRNNTQSPLINEKDLAIKGQTIKSLDLDWSADSKKILIEVISQKKKFFIFDIESKEKPISLDFLGENLSNLSFDPGNSQKIFFTQSLNKKNVLLSADYKKKGISDPILENLIAYKISNGSLYWLDKNGFLFQSNLVGVKITNFNLQPLALKKGGEYQIFIFGEKIFLEEGGNLYFFNDKSQSLEKISEEVSDLKPSPDLKKVVYFTNSEMWVFFLENIDNEQPQRKGEEKLFLTRFSEKINDVFWWTSHYLIFSVGNEIKITEIDDRDRINIYTLADFKNLKIFWDKYTEKLYVLSQRDLFSSKKLLP